MSTPNLAIAEIASNQNQKEVTANTAFEELEAAITSRLAKSLTDADYTLTATEGGEALGHMVFVFSGTLTAGRNIIVPTNKKLYLVLNSTAGGFALTVKTASGTGIAVGPNGYCFLYCDGTNVVRIGQDGFYLTAHTGAIVLTGTHSRRMVKADATGGAFNVTLPDATLCQGWMVTVKRVNSGANAVTVLPAGSPIQTIDGASSYGLSAQWKYVSVISDGANWLIVANN